MEKKATLHVGVTGRLNIAVGGAAITTASMRCSSEMKSVTDS